MEHVGSEGLKSCWPELLEIKHGVVFRKIYSHSADCSEGIGQFGICPVDLATGGTEIWFPVVLWLVQTIRVYLDRTWSGSKATVSLLQWQPREGCSRAKIMLSKCYVNKHTPVALAFVFHSCFQPTSWQLNWAYFYSLINMLDARIVNICFSPPASLYKPWVVCKNISTYLQRRIILAFTGFQWIYNL